MLADHAGAGLPGSQTSGAQGGGPSGHGHFEDAFIDNVLGKMDGAMNVDGAPPSLARSGVGGASAQERHSEGERWDAFKSQAADRAGPAGAGKEKSADQILAERRNKRQIGRASCRERV